MRIGDMQVTVQEWKQQLVNPHDAACTCWTRMELDSVPTYQCYSHSPWAMQWQCSAYCSRTGAVRVAATHGGLTSADRPRYWGWRFPRPLRGLLGSFLNTRLNSCG